MSLIGQPESYSDMLKRIFAVTASVGIICTFALASFSPAVHAFLESWPTEVKIGILDGVKGLYALLPLLVALVSRIFLLHDKVSDLLGIRRRFDIKYILLPLAEGVDFPTEGAKWDRIKSSRDVVMTRTFYRYASFRDPKIDVQLVRTAADRWGWFWCMIEPQVILLITSIVFAILREWLALSIVLVVVILLNLFAVAIWPQVRRGAKAQVDEILYKEEWKAEVRNALNTVAKVPTRTVAQPAGGTDV